MIFDIRYKISLPKLHECVFCFLLSRLGKDFIGKAAIVEARKKVEDKLNHNNKEKQSRIFRGSFKNI